MRGSTLDKRAKEIILQQIHELGEVTTEAVMDLVRPHYMFNALAAKEQAVRRKSHRLMSQFRDENGVRTCYNFEDSTGASKYINVDITDDLDALTGVNIQISSKLNGLLQAKKKIIRRAIELGGQMKMFDSDVQ
jgi:hypothetical protein